jgi:hypothetical protein
MNEVAGILGPPSLLVRLRANNNARYIQVPGTCTSSIMKIRRLRQIVGSELSPVKLQLDIA